MKIGSKIDDKYFVQEQVGNDTFIVVNISSGIKWVLKHLPLLTSTQTIKLLQIIRHPSLPRIFETYIIDDRQYFLLEYIEGITLLELCEKKGGKLSYFDACEYMACVSRTINFLHSQSSTILHLDIKPNNIVLSNNNLPCLIDYGTARNMQSNDTDDKDFSYEIYGTPGYAPLELLQGKIPDEKCDIFMIGMTLIRIITGNEPNPNLQLDTKSLTSMMPASVAKIILRCIMNNPQDRYSNAGELAYDLEVACNTTLSYDTFANREFSPISILNDKDMKAEYKLDSDNKDIKINEYHGKRKNANNRIFCVWDNCQFAAEISSALANQKKKVLLIDADLLTPGIDLLVDIKEVIPSVNRNVIGNSTLADLMEEYSKKRLSNESIRMFAQKTSIDNLSCLCGNYRMEDYEYYSTDGLVEIIKTASLGYDYVVISCGKFIYDEFTCVSLICADMVFIPITANTIKFREFNRYINFLIGRKQLEREKIAFIGFDYQSNEDLSFGTCDELCQGAFAGIISYSQKRRMMQGAKKPYVSAMESKIEKQYLRIIKNISNVNLN